MLAGNVNGAKVLVVGGAGFVGGNLVRRFLDEGCNRVVVIDNLLSSEPDNLPEDIRVELRVGSIADAAVLGALDDDFDFAFHLATYHGNQSSIADPLADHDNNLITSLKLFERLRCFPDLKRVVYASTGCALAEKGEGPATAVVEDGLVPLDFDSPYQISKVVGEMYGTYYHRMHGLPVVRARFQNVYGPGEVLGAGRWRGTPATIWRNVVPTFIYRAMKGQPLLVHGSGESTRDFIHVDDIVNGLLLCAVTPGIEGDVFNLASGTEVAIVDLASKINEFAGSTAGIELVPARGWDRSVQRFGSTEKSRRCLGFEASIGLPEGLSGTVGWTEANMERIERCITRHRGRYQVETW